MSEPSQHEEEGGLRADLLDDFYAECDELIAGTRSALALISRQVAAGNPPDRATAAELFRNLHSIKGSSAIVGLRPAEELAHRMEDIVRPLSKGQGELGEDVVDALLAATQRLEEIIGAHRLRKPVPAPGDAFARLSRHLAVAAGPREDPESAAEAAPPEAPAASDPVAEARRKGLAPWRVTFTPSPDLDHRGVNVASVRTRLLELGEILSATPAVQPGGRVTFNFVAGLRQPPAALEEWARDGIVLEPAAGETAGESISIAPSHIVRVDLARLDELMRIAGEMVIQRSRFEDRLQRTPGMAEHFRDINLALGRSLRELRAAISRVRLVPVDQVFARMPFVIREMMRGSDKRARVMLEGSQTQIDKYVIERLKEPLLHLVRNAFAHGIEPAAERERAGKPPEATIVLDAAESGAMVVLRVRDDGRGIDAAAVAARARQLGLPVPAVLDPEGVLSILCLPGFSSREQADLSAGRGVGLDVAARAIRELGGTLSLETRPGHGSEFTLRLPLTLAIVDALTIEAGGRICAVPRTFVEEIVQVREDEIRTIQDMELVPYRGALLPLARLRRLWQLPPSKSATLTLLVVQVERGRAGLAVDRAISQREVVVRSLNDPLVRTPGITGATELGDGRPILILDPVAILRSVVNPAARSQPGKTRRTRAQ